MTTLEEAAAQPPPAGPARTFFGEPVGLLYLSFTEAWERFSYYGMTALLVLYMSQSLFLPGHVEHVAGFAGFRAALEAVFGRMSTLALASQVFGLYTGFVYFTPVFGGWIADRFLGRRRAVMTGAVLMSAGQIAMAFDQSFLVALAALIIGCGLLKGNISVQVGQLYAPDDSAGRTRGFSIYSMGINFGATVGPLLCGLLAQLYGWHAGFALGGALMLFGLATYIAGYKTLSESIPARGRAQPAAKLDGNAWRAVAALVAVMALTIFQSIAYYQNSNIGLVWINAHVDLGFFGWRVPVAWFNSIDPLVSILSVAPLIALWKWQDRRGGEPGEIAKIATGAAMAATANLLLVIGSLGFVRVPVLFPVLYDVLLGIAFLYYWPTLLAVVSRAAPPAIKSTMMGVAFLTLFLSNITIGWLGGLYEHMQPWAFWAMHAAIAATGAVLALVSARPVTRLLNRHG
ncbi:MAG TPA: peptide MFS transporter [Rhizomicrobium sp.]|jgi:POT family proton-dependent oligopeptide transporter|nr:peptide MFS transporter [Rhizomicrobium sp.]